VRVTNDVTGRWMFVATGHEPGESVSEALAMGACSVVSIESQREDFHHAVDALLSLDGSYVPLPLLRWLAGTALASSADRSRAGGPPVRLTSREREILSLVSRGLTNTEIADSLTISTNTVRSHLHALAVKLEATSRMKIVTRARDLGFAEAAGILRSIPPQRIPA
jgi:DNA-binding NarL/FixJ family response regulator